MKLGVSHDFLDLFHVGEIAAQVGGKEFSCVMTFEVAGLITYPGVAGCVGFVEGVLGEFLPVFPYLVQDLLRVAIGHSACHEFVFQ